jgi:4a-hydroxytetrahydrobiopterin dehydratase
MDSAASKISQGARALAPDEVNAALSALDGWALTAGKLHRKFEFPDFAHAFGFMSAVAISAESMQHHPEWLNVCSSVEVWLVTHDARGISTRDLQLARRMNDLFEGTRRVHE